MQTKLIIFTILLLGSMAALTAQGASAQPSFVSAEAPASNANLTTPTPYEDSLQTAPGAPPLGLTLSLLGFCLLLLVILGVFVLGVIVRAQNRKDNADHEL